MIIYIWIAFFCMLVSCVLGAFVGAPVMGFSDGDALLVSVLTILSLLIIDVVIALVVRYVFPKKWFNPFAKVYRVSEKERKIYEKLKIRAWKDRIPETGKALVGFDKSKIANMSDNTYIDEFMRETAYAEIMHVLSVPFSFLVILISPKLFVFAGLPLVIGNILYQIMPVCVQRYNRYKLMIVHKRNERNAQK